VTSFAAAQLLAQPPDGEGIDEAPEAFELTERSHALEDEAEHILREVFGLGPRTKDTLGRPQDHGRKPAPGFSEGPFLSRDETGCQIAIAGVARGSANDE